MNQIFTTNHLIRYAYNETDLSETALIQKSLDNDATLAEQYQEMLSAMRLLDNVVLEPSENSMNSILRYLYSNTELAN